MAFDEDFHLGLIRLYADHASPFWATHPANSDAFGALTRDPSYLFHYIMSFPYRFIALFTNSEAAQVIFLRFINIALLASSLPLYRRLLLHSGASTAIVHSVLTLFVLVPIVPLLGAQINYDNLILPLIALILLVAVRINRDLLKRNLGATPLLQLMVLGLFASLVKYAFLPIFFAILLVLGVRVYHTYVKSRHSKLLLATIRQLPRGRMNKVLLTLFAVLCVLAFERYGLNVIRYHDPVPDCGKVLSIDQCLQYGPWGRDYNLNLNKGDFEPNPVFFISEWLRGMWTRSFFSLAGSEQDFQTRGPLMLPGFTAIVLVIISALLLAWYARTVWRKYDRPVLTMFAVVAGVYLLILLAEGFRLYVFAGKPVAVNGRYLLPILPLLMLLGGLAMREFLRNRPQLKVLVAILALLGFLWGGGIFTFILRSNDSWYWDSSAVRNANHAVQDVLGPITPGYDRPTAYLR